MDSTINPDYPVYTSANIGEVLPGVITPLTWSVLGSVLEHGFVEGARYYSLMEEKPKDNIFLAYFYNRAFLNLSYLCSLAHKIPGTSVEDAKKTVLGENYSQDFSKLGKRPSGIIKTLAVSTRTFRFLFSVKRRLKSNEEEIEKLLDDSVKYRGKLDGKVGAAFSSAGGRGGGNQIQ